MNQDEKSTNSKQNNQTTWPINMVSILVPMDEAI